MKNISDYEQKHINMLRPLLPECTVLLRANGDFPLDAPGKIALYGSGARRTLKGGTGSGEVNSRYFDTVEQGFENAGFTITTKAWLDAYDKVCDEALLAFRKELKAKAKAQHKNVMFLALGATVPEPEYSLPLDGEGDTAIYVLSRISGEGADREPAKGDIFLTDTETHDILELNRKYRRFLLVLNTGGVVDLSPVLEVSNILLLSQLGVENGDALADIVLGRANPSGRLAATWTAWRGHGAELDFGGYDDTRYREGIYVGYRYYNTAGEDVLFPFGYGLSYTTFEISEPEVSLEKTSSHASAKNIDDVFNSAMELTAVSSHVNTRNTDRDTSIYENSEKKCASESPQSVEITHEQVNQMSTKTRIRVSVNVKNTGSYPGKEVVQVYVSVPEDVLDQPYQTLAAWVKTPELAPTESGTFSAEFDLHELASFDTKKATYVLEAGDYIVRVGKHSRDTVPAAILKLEETVVVRRVKHALGKPDFKDEIPGKAQPVLQQKTETNHSIGSQGMPIFQDNDLQNTSSHNTKLTESVVSRKSFDFNHQNEGDLSTIPTLTIHPDDFDVQEINYDIEEPIDPRVHSLSDEELALFSNGAFTGSGISGTVGNASTIVCGAAGETAHVRDFPVLVMADGPAGLRISRQYFEDKKGLHSMEAPFPQSMLPFMPAPIKFLMEHFVMKKPKSADQIRHQFCTAIPIGTALAQSWNPAVAECCGDIVGAEMKHFGIHLWLAPALNIQRSIRCGRNFEYYSEDPLLSGRFAAAITRGVQKHPGRGVTIKHFAANNQEFNRSSSNSIVSERALREIYLKGFEICVRESAPKAVMTSYNLINGQHASTRRDLIHDILRCEFGFDGIVMTDWLIMGGMVPKDAKYASPKACDVAAAGGDLYMPGAKSDYKNILKALKSGALSRQQLEINASRVLRSCEF